jgi:hypothetical protein
VSYLKHEFFAIVIHSVVAGYERAAIVPRPGAADRRLISCRQCNRRKPYKRLPLLPGA